MIEGGNYLKLNEQYKFNNSIMEGGGGGVAAHGSTERFPCAVCGKSYLRKRHLQRHMRDECIGIPPRFSCDLCPSRFRRKYHMVRHLTSKHGIPPAIAQQTTGNSNRNNSTALKEEGEGAVGGLLAENLTLNHVNLGNCDNGLPENLTMRKENYEHEPTQMHHQHQHHHIHHQLNMGSASPSHMTSGDSGSDCNGGGTAGTSPIPPTHIMPMPTYGLTGAITAISAAAAHVEEKDAKILLEAAAAAAQAAAHNNNIQQTLGGSSTTITPPPTHEDTENVAENQTSLTTTTGNTGVALNSNANTTNEASYIKAEPLTPNKTMAPGQGALNMLDDEWKMKLSLQLISNSLLKERLMNTMPFAYKNN